MSSFGTDVGRPDPDPKTEPDIDPDMFTLSSVGSCDHEREVCVSPAPNKVWRSFLRYADGMSKTAEIRAKSYAAALEMLRLAGNHMPGVRDVSMDKKHLEACYDSKYAEVVWENGWSLGCSAGADSACNSTRLLPSPSTGQFRRDMMM